MPFFSIIIPVYNVAPYLRECLDSVLAQTFTDWEAVCVDDGSTDGSGAILDEYAAKDKRLRVIHQENKGVGAARNLGLKKVKGNWILFLDGDDAWAKKLLSIVAGMIDEYPSEKLFRFGFKRFDGIWNESTSYDLICNFEIKDISHGMSMHDLGDYLFWCFAYAGDLFENIRFPRYIRGEDWCVLNRIMLEKTDAFVSTPMLLYGYRNRVGSAVSSIPSVQVLCDEMDHRLDIMEMIDASGKKVEYAGNGWLEGYFTRQLYWIVESRTADKVEVEAVWRNRLHRLRHVNGLSKYGRFVAWSCSLARFRAWNWLVCYVIPCLCDGGSPIRWIKRKLNNVR